MTILIIIAVVVISFTIAYFLLKKPPKPPPGQDKAKKLRINMAGNQVTITNINKANSKVYEFDIFIDGTNLNITSYQCALRFNQNIINGGVLTFEYITGTCEINNPPTFGLGVNTTDGPRELTLGAGPGNDIINSQKRLGKFRLTNTVNYSNEELNLSWNFAGAISTIFTGAGFSDITSTLLFNIIVGDTNMITINDSQKVLLTAEALSAAGNSAQVDGPVVWAVSASAGVVQLVTVDDKSVYAVAIGPFGLATVQATADADLTSGTSYIVGSIDVEVVGGPAVTLNVIAGTPEVK
jgi:hypothetical protein